MHNMKRMLRLKEMVSLFMRASDPEIDCMLVFLLYTAMKTWICSPQSVSVAYANMTIFLVLGILRH